MADGLYVEQGTTGVPTLNGLSTDRRQELQGPAGISAMATALKLEPALFTAHNAITLSALRATWTATGGSDKPQDRRAAEYLESLLDDMAIEFNKTLRFILSGVAFGFSDVYTVYKRRNGRNPKRSGKDSAFDDGFVGLHKLAVRRQETITLWERDDVGDVTGMEQTDPDTGRTYPVVPIDKLLHFSFGNDRGDWEGQGWLEPAYKPYRMIVELEQIYGIGQQRAHVGLPVFEYAEPRPTDELQNKINAIGRGLIVNQQQFVSYPADKVKMRLETVSNAGGGELREQIKQLRWELAAMVLLTFLRLGNSASGSRALADPLMDLFKASIDSYNDTVASVFNRHLVPRLMRANPELARGLTDYPQFTPSSVSDIPLQVISYLAQISTFLNTAQTPDANWLREGLGMELVDYEEGLVANEEKAEPTEDTESPQDDTDEQEEGADEKEAEEGDEEEAIASQPRWVTTVNLAEAERMTQAALQYNAAARARRMCHRAKRK